MFERFPRSSRRVLQRARDEAAVLGSPKLEAEHLLLALTRDEDPVVRQVLATARLEHDALRQALEAQDEAALASIGVSRTAFALPPNRPLTRTPGWSTSSKQALIRAKTVAAARHDGHIEPPHLLLAVLRAEAGTVPRALAFAGVDRIGLAVQTETALAGRR
jgi:ATP-dependent Clp protease ATP-binding subunit ClpA